MKYWMSKEKLKRYKQNQHRSERYQGENQAKYIRNKWKGSTPKKVSHLALIQFSHKTSHVILLNAHWQTFYHISKSRGS